MTPARLQPVRARQLARDESGAAAIEFAFVLPFLILLFIGGFQLMDAISAYRKVSKTVETLADLTTQNTTITADQADQILGASRQVMSPYSPANAVLRISQVQVQATGQATVTWSRALNGDAYAAGTNVPISLYLATPGNYYVYAEITYNYTPNIASSLIGNIPLNQTIFMSPRNSGFIAYNN